MTTKSILLFLVAAVTLVLTACQEQNDPTTDYIPVRVLSLKAHNGAQHEALYSATIIPKTQVNLAFKVNGYIESILQTSSTNVNKKLIDRGDQISKGIILAKIKNNQYQDKVKQASASLASANAAWIKATADYKHDQTLYKDNSLTAPDYDSARQEYITAHANVAAARAQLDDAQQNLAYCTLKSPTAGLLLKRNIEVGSLVNPGSVAFVLADMSTVKVVFAVPDAMLKIISLGDKLDITTRTFPDQVFSGNITNISPSSDLQARVFEVEISINNAQGNLKNGMVVAFKVPKLPQQGSHLAFLPIIAVVRSKNQENAYEVYTIEQKKGSKYAHLQNVQLGDVHGNTISVLSGLKANDQVIVSGVNTVWDGAQVRIMK